MWCLIQLSHQGIAELCHSQGKERVEAEPGHRAGLRTQNVLTGDGFGVPGASLDPSKQDPEAGAVPDHCPGARARAGPCLVSHLRGVAATRDPAGTVPRGVGRVTPRQDPSVVPSLQELPLLGTSGHICRGIPSTSVPSEVQK